MKFKFDNKNRMNKYQKKKKSEHRERSNFKTSVPRSSLRNENSKDDGKKESATI